MLYWDPSYRCFTFNQEDMTPTVEEYVALLRIALSSLYKVFWKKTKGIGFIKKMAQIMGIYAKVIDQVKKKNDSSECHQWEFIKKYMSKSKDDKRVSNVFTDKSKICIYFTLLYFILPCIITILWAFMFDFILYVSFKQKDQRGKETGPKERKTGNYRLVP